MISPFLKILIISFTDLSRDPRVKRQIRFLKDKYEVHTVGLKSAEEENVIFYPLERKKNSFFRNVKKALLCKIRMYDKVYWDTYEFDILLNILSDEKFDLIISNDVESLPFTLKIANGAKIVLDAHEYSPREFEDQFLWRFILQHYKQYQCKKYIRYCDKMITVSKGIGEEYYKNFDIKPIIITNACEFIDITPSPVDEQHFKLIHHGAAIPSRKLEIMIEMMNHLDERFKLDFVLVNNNPGYFQALKTFAKDKKNIRFLSPVPMQEIVKFIDRYDIGLYILPPTNLSYKFILPNKLFEFIQARLAVAIGPSHEMARIVKQYDLGIIAKDFKPKTMAKELNKLTKDKIDYYKHQSDKVAHELSSERNHQIFVDLVSGLIKNNRS